MMKRFGIFGGAFALVGVSAIAMAQLVPPTNQPAVLSSADLVPVVPSGAPTSATSFASLAAISQYGDSLPQKGNALIGGDSTTNLWQRATTGASTTTTVGYGGPDRWAYWSGTSTAMTVSRSTTATDVPAGYKSAFKMARTSGQTGVVQMCMLQEVESALAYQFQGTTAELDFHAYTGANYSAASSNMTAYIITGTGTDEGVAGSSSVAFALNAGGGGTGTWTGQANATAAVISLGGVSTAGRYAAVANIPAGATEIAVALCYTPVGTAGTNDYVAFAGIQLVRAPALSAKASATAGYACSPSTGGVGSPGIMCSAFDRSRGITQEALLQYRYFYKIAEGAAIQTRAPCAAITTTTTNCMLFFPVAMRQAPVFTGDGGFTAGFATPTSTTQATLGGCTTLALATVVSSTVASTNNALITCTASTVPAAGIASFLYDNNGSGVIKGSAEL